MYFVVVHKYFPFLIYVGCLSSTMLGELSLHRNIELRREDRGR